MIGKTTEKQTSKHERIEKATVHPEPGNQTTDETRKPLMSTPQETERVTKDKEVSSKENPVTSSPMINNISGNPFTMIHKEVLIKSNYIR